MDLKETIKENLQNFLDDSPYDSLIRDDQGETIQKCTISEIDNKIVITITERSHGNQT